MLSLLRLFVCGWAISQGSLAVLAVPAIESSSWRKPDVTLSMAERVSLAGAAIERSRSGLNTTTGFRATVYYQMADFDDLTNQTAYRDILPNLISQSTKSQENSAKPESVGHAAIRAYMAYKNPVFLELANESWAFARSFTISEADLASRSILGKDFSLQATCQDATMVGGTFETTNSTDPTISGFASSLSALLAEANPTNPIYLNAAFDSADFITGQLLAGNLVQSRLSAALDGGCILDEALNSLNTGVMIEGLAVLHSIANNASMQTLLDDVITATLSNDDWQTPNGIIAQGSSKLGEKLIVRGLAEAYARNATSPDLRPYIQKYIGVQFNAVVDLATETGDDIYGGAWTGPPILNDVDPARTVSGQSPPSPTPTDSVRPHAQKKRVALIAGSVVGAVVLVALVIGVWFILRRRTQAMLSSSTPSSQRPISPSTVERLAAKSTSPPYTFSTFQISHTLERNSTAMFDPTAPSQVSPRSPTPPRNSVSKLNTLSTLEIRHSVSAQPVQSPVSTAPSAAVPLNTALMSSPVEQLPTTELVRVLNERLRGRRWDEEEVPPEYDAER
ncbi:hypothetical protein B0H19DRAFT_1311313 [Mycena capillaripes]|nr:hypothetical protein B0H19DRAFT_1311313 [Mycena capillaripes]